MQADQVFTLNPDFATGKGVYMNRTAGLVLEMCGTGQKKLWSKQGRLSVNESGRFISRIV
ncbi:MAG: hypothetical protein Q3M24_00065 [Candidatus Electrothrix aestuarii]|uniref:Uncharacterized protein n=1 Tax=Candidatus Electrothrix aestuarii TaxID=3062594 RepID=A0AAU8LWD0_9BACT